ALFCEPYELVDRPPPHFIGDIEYVVRVVMRNGVYMGGNVIMSTFFSRRKDNAPIFMRTITFTCGDVIVGVVTAFSNINFEQLSAQSFNTNLNTMYSLKTEQQACIVLEDMGLAVGSAAHGPQIFYSTDSINLIINARPPDIENKAFLSLVAVTDIIKASLFLETILCSNDLVFECLQLLQYPLEDSPLRSPRHVTAEFVGMKSDTGIILLCQLKPQTSSQSNRRASRNLSLRDIISSDAGAPNFPRQWRRIDL
ncbi:hypothetical protein GGI12_006222, partial [Dipsacomyces acuminosporus]